MENLIYSGLSPEYPWRNSIIYKEQLPSTSDLAKKLAQDGAPEGTAVIAAHQTAGRGRMGRQFYAPANKGVYLSLILRPDCTPDKLMHLTCATAVAACDAVNQCAGVRPKIKWTNDLILDNRKLGGILTELSINSATAKVDWAVVGIGINCTQKPGDFPPELCQMATSLLQSTGKTVAQQVLAGQLLDSLYRMNSRLLTHRNELLQLYRQDCMTLNQDIMLQNGEKLSYGRALDIDETGGLVVQFDCGEIKTVRSGEISIRGLYGYV